MKFIAVGKYRNHYPHTRTRRAGNLALQNSTCDITIHINTVRHVQYLNNVSSHVTRAFVSPDFLWTAPGWSPAYFAGPASVALRASHRGSTVADLGGQVLEGWRVSETPGALTYDARAAATPIYRQSNVGRLRLLLSAPHWEPPQMVDRWCVQPGDVVLNKLAPVRAALVSPAARRHPVDGNSLIVRGLPRSTATWLALCLNRPEYEQLLLIESGVLRRVGLGTLANLRLPSVPGEMNALSLAVRELLDEMLLVGESIQRVKAEAAQVAVAPSAQRDLREGTFFERGAMSSDSWLPAAVALRSEQSALAEELAWVPVRALATADDRSRLLSSPEGARALRLSDVADDLFVGSVEEKVDLADLATGRTLGKPLIAGEVLLSTLGTSFRVAYVDDSVPPNTFPTDGWVRLRFRETPAAWALLLSTHQARWQTARLAVGSVQQFVPPEALLSIHIPTPDRETRDRWQRAVERHHAQRRLLDNRWNTLLTALARVFDDTHGLSASRTLRGHEVLQ